MLHVLLDHRETENYSHEDHCHYAVPWLSGAETSVETTLPITWFSSQMHHSENDDLTGRRTIDNGEWETAKKEAMEP